MKEIARHVVLPFFAVLALRLRENACAAFRQSTGDTQPGCCQPGIAYALRQPANRRATPRRLHIFCWSEYIPQQIVDAFSEETGIKVSIETYSSNEEMLAKLFAGGGNYDIIQPSEYVIEGLIKEGLLTPIDHARIANMKNLARSLRTCRSIRGTNIRFLTWRER